MNTTRRPRAVLYLRQSVAKEESISLELQEDAGRRYAQQSGYDVVAVEADHGISGRTWKRPAVQRVMAMIEEQQADVIILWKWSRLSRSRLDWAVAIDKVEAAGGQIESATEQVDVSTSTGRFARGMLAEFAAFESERIGDTWKEAHRRRVEQGLPATGKKRFGYDYDRATGFTPDPVEGPVLQECYRKYITGSSFHEITDYLNDGPTRPGAGYSGPKPDRWSPNTVRRVMDNPFATGRFNSKGTVLQGIHEPLISQETWEQYQVRRTSRRITRSSTKEKYPYTGLIFCEICGHGMYAGLFGSDRTIKYRCNGAANWKLHPGGYVMNSTLEATLIPWLAELAEDINKSTTDTPASLKTPDPTPRLRRALIKVQARLEGLTEKLIDGTVPQDVYERMRDQWIAEKASLEKQLMAVRVESRLEPVKLPPDLMNQWDEMPAEVKREILARVVSKIVVKPGRPRAEVRIVARWEDNA
ncbi:recombinase family protein [Glutamicibacter halophytocola]|uniref:Recombinase family protein n=1 Tax=Glutamicibacter halophytocola TaxID=1933880 RepID=A0ABX5Y413_9MICC|nr:recombinase family protein [Glutamicibacter halophytocola]QDY64847.1 recombinase family protein [Glutamicibacter halophytocola]